MTDHTIWHYINEWKSSDNYLSQSTESGEIEQEKEASEQIILFDKNGDGFELSTKSNIIEHIRNKSIVVSRLYFNSKYAEEFQES